MINILILENDKSSASNLTFILTNWEYKVIGIAKNYYDAIHFCEKNKIDLIIAETKIDGKPDGIETVFTLQEIYNIPVIFTTTHIGIETLTKAVKVDFIGYLIKPYRENDLLIVIRLAIAKYNLLEHKTSTYRGYIYDVDLNKIYYNKHEIILTAHEKQLFLLLFHKRGTLSTHEEIDEIIWNNTYTSSEKRRQLIHRLKIKLPQDSIEIVRGLGYKLK